MTNQSFFQSVKFFDCFSPSITLYYKGNTKHNSFWSGVFSIAHIFIFLVISFYYFYVVVKHKQSTAFYFKKYVEDPGIIPINKETIDHTVDLKGNALYDPKAFIVIGYELGPSKILPKNDEFLYSHWQYDLCHKNSGNFSLCIQRKFNKTEEKMYEKGNENFSEPAIFHGTGNNNSLPYTIIIKPCRNTTYNNNSCYTNETIHEMIYDVFSIMINFSDRYVNVGFYENPFVHYIRSFEFSIFRNALAAINIYYNPTIVRTHEGFLFDSVNEKYSYTFEQVTLGSYELKTNNNIGMISLLVNNQENVYERTYLSITDVLPSISAIAKISWCLFYSINFFVNKFVILTNFGFMYQKNNYKINRVFSTSFSNQNDSFKHLKTNIINDKHFKVSSNELPTASFFKAIEFSKKTFLFHLFKCKESSYLKNVIRLRQEALAEERMIYYYLLFFSYNNNNSNSNFREINKCLTHKSNKDSNNVSRNVLIKQQNFLNSALPNKIDD